MKYRYSLLNKQNVVAGMKLLLIIYIMYALVSVHAMEGHTVDTQYTYADLLAKDIKDSLPTEKSLYTINQGLKTLDFLQREYSTSVRLTSGIRDDLIEHVFTTTSGLPWDHSALLWGKRSGVALNILKRLDYSQYDQTFETVAQNLQRRHPRYLSRPI